MAPAVDGVGCVARGVCAVFRLREALLLLLGACGPLLLLVEAVGVGIMRLHSLGVVLIDHLGSLLVVPLSYIHGQC